MPRKTKEINVEETVKKPSKLDKKIAMVSSKLNIDKPKKTKSKVKTNKSSKSKSDNSAKETKLKNKKDPIIKTPKTKESKKVKTKSTSTKEKASKVSKKISKKSTKTSTISKSKSKKVALESSIKTTGVSKLESTKVSAPENVEYYDLPYKYNQTVVKVLYQNPTTLFVYWEISDDDIQNYKNTYGDNFFETTKPVLVVYNNTLNYYFEIDINDFANSWYFNINDSKCNYRVELIRKPISYNQKIKSDSIFISSSNQIESPNDKILFSTNEPYTVYFRNVKNNDQRKVNLAKLLTDLNLANKKFGFPIIRNVYDLYKFIYHTDDIKEFSIDLNNPSSGNPSSYTLSSRFI